MRVSGAAPHALAGNFHRAAIACYRGDGHVLEFGKGSPPVPKRFLTIATSTQTDTAIQICIFVLPQLEMEEAFSRRAIRRERVKQQRKHHTAEENVAILRRHFLDKVPV